MALSIMAAHAAAEWIPQHLALAGRPLDGLARGPGSGPHLTILAESGDHLVRPAQAAAPTTNDGASYAERVQNVAQEEQLSWLTTARRHFIGVFQKGGETFAGFVTGIIPTLVVLMTAFYAVTELIGERRVHGAARRGPPGASR